MEFQAIGRVIVTIGIVLIVLGLLIEFIPKLTFFGRLPGDINIKRENFSFYFPIVTSIVISLIITVVLNLLIGRK